MLAKTLRFANPKSTSNIPAKTSDDSLYIESESCFNSLGSGVLSSKPFIAAPLLSASKYWPKTLKLAESEISNNQSDLKLTWLASSRSWPFNKLVLKPSLSVDTTDILVATLSDTGTFTAALTLVKS